MIITTIKIRINQLKNKSMKLKRIASFLINKQIFRFS